MKLKATKDFTYFHNGYARKDYGKGEEIETEDEEMAKVAVIEGWAKSVCGKAEPTPEKVADPVVDPGANPS